MICYVNQVLLRYEQSYNQMPRNQNKMDSSIRNKPSVVPLKSPSPDFSNSYGMSPTFSPSRQQIKRNLQGSTKTKGSNIKMNISWEANQKQNRTPSTVPAINKIVNGQQQFQHISCLTKSRQRIVTEVFPAHHHYNSKHQSAPVTHIECSCSKVSHKNNDELVGQLRKILAMISETEFVSEFSADENFSQLNLKSQNEKLKLKVEALQRIMNQQRKKQGVQVNHDILRRINILQTQNHDLKNHIYRINQDFQQERVSLIESNQNLAIKLNSLDQAAKKLSLENERLFVLLKQKDQSERRVYQDYQDLKESVLLKSNQESIINANNISIASEGQKQKRLAIIRERYNNSLQEIKGQIQQAVKVSIKNAAKSMSQIQRKVKETENRLQTLNKFIIAALRMKGKSEYLKRSKVIKQIYQINYQSDLKKMNQLIQQIKIQKQNALNQADQRQQALMQRVKTEEKSNENLRRQNNKLQIEVEQLSLKSLQFNSQIKEIEVYKNLEIEQLNRIILLKNRQIQDIKRNTQLRISQACNSLQSKQSQWRFLLLNKQKQVNELKQAMQLKVRQLVSSYEKQIQIQKKELARKSSQLKEITISRTEQQNELLSRLKLLQFEKKDIQQKMERNYNNYQYEKQETSAKIEQLRKQVREKEISQESAINQIRKLVEENKNKDKYIGQLEAQLQNLRKAIQNTKVLKETLQRTQIQYKNKELSILSRFKNEIQSKQQQLRNIRGTLSRLKSRSIVNDLTQIKELIKSSNSQRLQCQLNEITALYGRLNLQFQNKLGQNEQLQKQKMELKQRIFQFQQKIVIFSQKIRYLQKNVEIYAGQLKQRKEFCQGLIQQKSTLEKQVILLKKNCFDQKGISSSIQKIIMVSKKIDELIIIENERQQATK